MKKTLRSLAVAAGLLRIGFMGPDVAQAQMMILAESESLETTAREHVLIIATPDLLTNSLFQSLLSSYVQTDLSLTDLPVERMHDKNENRRAPEPPAGTHERNAVSGGTSGVRDDAERPVVGERGGITSPTTLQLSELLANTAGDDAKEEYLVLKNTGGEPVNLNGWSLVDASGKTFAFQGGTIAPGASRKVMRPESGIALNNDADTVSLISPDKQLIDSTTYEKAKPDDRFVRDGTVWRFASQISSAQPEGVQSIPVETGRPVKQALQPAAAAESPQPETTKPAAQPDPKPAAQPAAKPVPTPAQINIAAAKQQSDDARVAVVGTATVAPGILGKQFFYLQDETGAVQVYKHDALFPTIAPGASVTLKGQMSTSGAERRVKIPKDGTLTVTATDGTAIPSEKTIAELSPALSGMLVRTTGLLSRAGSDTLEMEEGGKTLEVSLSDYADIDTSLLAAGARLEITGIVRPSGDTVKLFPRSQNDLRIVEEPAPAASAAGTVEPGKTQRDRRDQLIAGILAAASSAALVIWIVRQYSLKRQQTYATPAITPPAQTLR